ncbi:MAG: hypothetical protein LBE32_07965 [Burkholderiales bacterium]|jgi:hypothetical protein|nr:hypothetical protein [Burkholderiales bacterium]
MKSFFDQKYRCCCMVFAVLLVAGCTCAPVAPEPEEVSSSVAEAPEGASPVLSIEDSERDVAAALEEALLRKQLENHVRFQKLLEDLARYRSLNVEEVQRMQTELNSKISASQGGENGSRVRLAYLLSLHPSGLGDQRALLMLETVIKNEKVSTSLRHLASVLRAQVQEKQRALQKLDALRDVDRLLLEERLPESRTPPLIAPPKRP